ncbi:PREDICTED: uncharacterized protein LOC102012802 isoform X3 [Chinchilla lanigera]|uniref:uncharacterized protein LOC102012802 isoform X3 n=1 Tax=Chinchilla lanigera TaxID=34839 RepID=UPI0006963833|nr:PREDICTED: uncharacterized protein LOC102012802 isoform X3 [Chinchilla lanigera]
MVSESAKVAPTSGQHCPQCFSRGGCEARPLPSRRGPPREQRLPVAESRRPTSHPQPKACEVHSGCCPARIRTPPRPLPPSGTRLSEPCPELPGDDHVPLCPCGALGSDIAAHAAQFRASSSGLRALGGWSPCRTSVNFCGLASARHREDEVRPAFLGRLRRDPRITAARGPCSPCPASFPATGGAISGVWWVGGMQGRLSLPGAEQRDGREGADTGPDVRLPGCGPGPVTLHSAWILCWSVPGRGPGTKACVQVTLRKWPRQKPHSREGSGVGGVQPHPAMQVSWPPSPHLRQEQPSTKGCSGHFRACSSGL